MAFREATDPIIWETCGRSEKSRRRVRSLFSAKIEEDVDAFAACEAQDAIFYAIN